MDALLDILRGLFSSDAIVVLVLGLSAVVYLKFLRPALDKKEELEKIVDDKIHQLATREDISGMLSLQKHDNKEIESTLLAHRVQFIQTIEEANRRLGDMLEKLLEKADSGHHREMEQLIFEIGQLEKRIKELIDNTKELEDTSRKSNMRLDLLVTNFTKVAKSFTGMNNLIEALITELERKRLINKIDRRIVNNVKSTMDVTRKDLNGLVSVLYEIFDSNHPQSPADNRFDRLLDDVELDLPENDDDKPRG